MKFLAYTGVEISAGISHQRSNLAAMIREAALSGRYLIVPAFQLSGQHNNGRELRSQMDEYFDFANVTVDGEPMRLLTTTPEISRAETITVSAGDDIAARSETLVIKAMPGVALVRVPLEAIYPKFARLAVQVPVHPALTGLAARIAVRLPPRAVWVHARRGDKLSITAQATAPENILRVVQSVAPETGAIHIATDERELEFFAPLARHYALTTHRDLPELHSAAAEDNYRVFLIEQTYGAHFPVRISTFRTQGDYFHGALCELAGWQ